MAFIKSLFRSDEAQLMLIVDSDTGTPYKNDNGDEMGLLFNNLKSEACKKVMAKFHTQFKKREPSLGERERFSIDLLSAATVGFHNLQIDPDGEVVEYSDDLARDIFQNSDVIRKQADEFLGNDEHFLKKVLTESAPM